MECNRIFGTSFCLHAVVNAKGNDNELISALKNFADPEFLFNFFTEHKQDLDKYNINFKTNYTVGTAVKEAQREAAWLFDIIRKIDESSEADKIKILDQLFTT